MVDARASEDQEQVSDHEWPTLPGEYMIVEKVAFVEMFRSGRNRSINITEQVSDAIRETSEDLIGAALLPHGLDMIDVRNIDRP